MNNELPQELVTIHLIDMDFVAIVLNINDCNAEVKWLRRANAEEYRRGLEVVLSIAMELKTELKKTYALVGP